MNPPSRFFIEVRVLLRELAASENTRSALNTDDLIRNPAYPARYLLLFNDVELQKIAIQYRFEEKSFLICVERRITDK